MRTTRITTAAAALVSAAVLAGPAGAVPTDVVSGGSTAPDPQLVVQRTVTVPDRSSGFDWGSAGIGAAGAIGAVAIVLGSTRRRRGGPPGSIAAR